MIIDSRLEMTGASGQAVTASAATTDYIDLSVAGDAVNELYINCVVTTSTASTQSTGKVTFSLQTCASTDFSSVTTLITGTQSGSIPAAGTKLMSARVPRGVLRYVRGYFTVATNDFTAGVMKAFLTYAPQANDLSA